ncbi:MAG: NADH-quinone oxidoreductase subunit A [Candidatus Acidiferrales bacterium]
MIPVHYIPILIFAALAAAFPVVALVVFKRAHPDPPPAEVRGEAHECVVSAEGAAHGWHGDRLYIVAILFVIFDAEIVFLFPWAVKFSQMGAYGLLSMGVFLGILIVGYIWLYQKGALDWV